jgi:glutamate racemase
MQLNKEQPIGIFDSGVGGLTVASAINRVLPNEKIIYIGDTFHLPYGDKSKEAVIYYSTKISDFLLKKKCKVILIACNTASSNAYQTVKEHVGNRALVINVIDPVIEHVASADKYKNIGVIGTKGTINSDAYTQKIQKHCKNIKVSSLATPLLVPMIEEGFIFDDISNAIIRSYLKKDEMLDIDSLILGCTHYPIIKNQIKKAYDFKVDIIDSAHIVAEKVKRILEKEELLSTNNKADHRFYVSDYTNYFEKIAQLFFEKPVNLEKIDLWEK